MNEELKVFAGRSHPELANKICQYLGIQLGEAMVRSFPDGETEVKLLEDVRGRDAFVVQSTCTPVDRNLMELLILVDSLKRASADRITAVIPYFGYARQDRKDEGRVPITAKLVANLITTAGVDRVLTMDLHAAQIQGFFDVPVDHLYASPVFTEYFRAMKLDSDELVVVSPDVGGSKMVRAYCSRLGGTLAIVDKRRVSAEQAEQMHVIGGPLEGRTALIFDDMITTAGSMSGAAKAVAANGAKEIYACATHAVLCGPAVERLNGAPLKEIVVTDTVPVAEQTQKELPLRILSVAPLLGETIKRIHRNESVSVLFED